MSDETLHGSLTKSVNDMPWWAKLTLLVGLTFGVPTAILMFYLAQDAGLIRNPVAEELEELKGLNIQHETTMRELVKLFELRENERIARAKERQKLCVLRAKTDVQRQDCFAQ